MASPASIPPYVFSESNTGIQIDIIRESLAFAGHTLSLKYVSNNRGIDFVKTKTSDGMINTPTGISDLYYSEPTIEFQNGVVALKSRQLDITKISDLQSLRVVGFQNASNYFGRHFKTMTQTNKHYVEVVNQLAQVNMLFQNRCDAIIIDRRIFSLYLNNHKDKPSFSQTTLFYNILPPSPRYVAFHNEALRDEFNEGLKQLKATSRYQAIIDSYLQ